MAARTPQPRRPPQLADPHRQQGWDERPEDEGAGAPRPLSKFSLLRAFKKRGEWAASAHNRPYKRRKGARDTEGGERAH
jgi:hypothetical protein